MMDRQTAIALRLLVEVGLSIVTAIRGTITAPVADLMRSKLQDASNVIADARQHVDALAAIDEPRPCPLGCGGDVRLRRLDPPGSGFELTHASLTTDPFCLLSTIVWAPTRELVLLCWNENRSIEDRITAHREESS